MKPRINEVMQSNPKCIGKNEALSSLVELISSQGFSHIPVVENGKLIGIVSKTDLMNKFLKMLEETSGKYYTKMLMEHVSVEQIMKVDPISVHENDSIEYATELLLQGEFHGLVVLNNEEEVIGIITAYDILKSQSI